MPKQKRKTSGEPEQCSGSMIERISRRILSLIYVITRNTSASQKVVHTLYTAEKKNGKEKRMVSHNGCNAASVLLRVITFVKFDLL